MLWECAYAFRVCEKPHACTHGTRTTSETRKARSSAPDDVSVATCVLMPPRGRSHPASTSLPAATLAVPPTPTTVTLAAITAHHTAAVDGTLRCECKTQPPERDRRRCAAPCNSATVAIRDGSLRQPMPSAKALVLCECVMRKSRVCACGMQQLSRRALQFKPNSCSVLFC